MEGRRREKELWAGCKFARLKVWKVRARELEPRMEGTCPR